VKYWICAFGLGFLISASLLAADPKPENSVGQKIPSFKLNDYLGTSHKVMEWSKNKALVVVFVGVECPVAKLFGQRIAGLHAKYESKDVAFIAIDSNQQDSLAEIAHYAREHKIEFPILKDPGNKVAAIKA
jgi:peroxiredoxin